MEVILGSALSQGLGYALFVVLFYYTLKKQDERDKKSEDREVKSQQREDRLQEVIGTNQKIISENQNIIHSLTNKLNIVQDIQYKVDALENKFEKIIDRDK